MKGIIFDITYACLFILLAFSFPLFMFVFAKPICITYCIGFILSILRSKFKVDNTISRYAYRNLLAIDQLWQVFYSPLLNIGVTSKHCFGDEDETASSVVGKNLREQDALRWRIIEKFLSIIIEFGYPHAIPSIEDDEGYAKKKSLICPKCRLSLAQSANNINYHQKAPINSQSRSLTP